MICRGEAQILFQLMKCLLRCMGSCLHKHSHRRLFHMSLPFSSTPQCPKNTLSIVASLFVLVYNHHSRSYALSYIFAFLFSLPRVVCDSSSGVIMCALNCLVLLLVERAALGRFVIPALTHLEKNFPSTLSQTHFKSVQHTLRLAFLHIQR